MTRTKPCEVCGRKTMYWAPKKAWFHKKRKHDAICRFRMGDMTAVIARCDACHTTLVLDFETGRWKHEDPEQGHDCWVSRHPKGVPA